VPQRNDRVSNFNQLAFLKAADLQNILENHKLQIFQNIPSNMYNSC